MNGSLVMQASLIKGGASNVIEVQTEILDDYWGSDLIADDDLQTFIDIYGTDDPKLVITNMLAGAWIKTGTGHIVHGPMATKEDDNVIQVTYAMPGYMSHSGEADQVLLDLETWEYNKKTGAFKATRQQLLSK